MIRPLLEKEVKDLLRDPRIILPFILSAVLLPVLGLVISIPMRTAMEETFAGPQAVGVVDLDTSQLSSELITWLKQRGFTVTLLPAESLDAVAREASARGLELVIIVPKGFGDAVSQRKAVNVTFLNVVQELSVFGGARTALVGQVVEEYVAAAMLKGTGVDPAVVRNPLRTAQYTFLVSKGMQFPGDPAALVGLNLAVIFIPLIIISIALVVMQMAATSMAVENEEKTLETLLTLPVHPRDILLAKILGMFAVALVGSLLELVGLAAYLHIFSSQILQPPASEQLTRLPETAAAPQSAFSSMTASLELITPQSLGYLLLSLLLSLFFCAALGAVAGALSKDVRIASTIVSPLGFLVLLPGYFIIFMSSKSMGPILRAIFYTLPPTQPAILSKEIVTYTLPAELPAYLAASLAITLLVVYFTARVFSLETLSRLQHALSRITALKRKK